MTTHITLYHKVEKISPDLSQEWKQTIFSILLVFLLSLTIFYDSWSSIVKIWYRSNTFSHGFVILPISMWLIWTQRNDYIPLKPQTDLKIIVLVLVFGFVWLLADLINVQVVKQFATVSILVSSLFLLLGLDLAKKMLFPLLFLFFMVPVGEELIPYLMEFTATLTVSLIRLTGIAIYREGLHFTLTSGRWSIEEACSGISYLIASITLGLVYAYLSYQSLWKRSIFVLLSIIVPLFANGLRAYIIVMIGHLSDKSLAVGADHLIYGGLFFALVMMILLYLGSFWKDRVTSTVSSLESIDHCKNTTATKRNSQKILMTLLLITLSYGIWPFTSNWLSEQQQQVHLNPENTRALESKGWIVSNEPNWKWRADFKGVTNESITYFTKDENVIAIYQASFAKETQGEGELVNSQNVLLSSTDVNWKIVDKGSTQIGKNSEHQFWVDETIIRGAENDLLAFRWYHIGQQRTANNYMAKGYQLSKRLLADPSPEYVIVSLIETQKNRHDQARKQLIQFVEIWLKMES